MDASEALTLQASPRTAMGKKNRSLRRNGLTPVHIYGLTTESAALQAETATLKLVLREAGYTTPVTVKVDGGEEAVTLIRGISRHPVSGDLVHVDFMRVDILAAIEVDVPVVLINAENAPVTRLGDITITQATHEITVRARPYDVPHQIEVDCSTLLTLDDVIHASDLKLPENVELASDPDLNIARGEESRVTAEADLVPAEAPAEGEEAAEGEEVEGEAGKPGEGSPEEGSDKS